MIYFNILNISQDYLAQECSFTRPLHAQINMENLFICDISTQSIVRFVLLIFKCTYKYLLI
jgi:hypothetical protein